jgi:tetratricopeptide (TPR) repeat protein
MGCCVLLSGLVLIGGCSLNGAQHQADAAFRKALTAHLRGDDDGAEAEYHKIIALGFDWSAVWNNLAVVEAHRHHYIGARRLLSKAVASGPRSVVALTNYGVMSYWLADLKEAKRALEAARLLREDNLNHIPSIGDNHFTYDLYARATAPLLETAKKYLTKIDSSEVGAAVPVGPQVADLMFVRAKKL